MIFSIVLFHGSRPPGILSPRLETRLLIAYVLGADASGILPHRIELGAGEAERLEVAVAERIQHKPLCKIIGSKAFYKHDFMVSCDVLSPRPDTEILVEAAVQIARRKKMRQVLDLGTGSGCILLSILRMKFLKHTASEWIFLRLR